MYHANMCRPPLSPFYCNCQKNRNFVPKHNYAGEFIKLNVCESENIISFGEMLKKCAY